MKVHGDINPGRFSVSPIPNRDGFALARFYENAREYSETRDDMTVSGWVYDEYHLELQDYPALAADIEANYDAYLAAAKATEAPTLAEQNRADIAANSAAIDDILVSMLEG